MSVLVEFSNVIIRRIAIERSYPGGMPQFVQDVPNSTFCADRHLVRVGFMCTEWLEAYVEQLEQAGLQFAPESGSDLCVVDELSGPHTACDWLRFEPDDGVHSRCSWSGDEPGKLAMPPSQPRHP